MRTLNPTAVLIAVAALGLVAGCGAPAASDTFIATSPGRDRIAVASAGMRNVRVLRVLGGSVVREREVFVPEGEAVAGIAWSDDGRDVIVATRGARLVVDTRSWCVEDASRRTVVDSTQRTRG